MDGAEWRLVYLLQLLKFPEGLDTFATEKWKLQYENKIG